MTFDSYAELRDTFRDLAYAEDVDAVVFASNGGNFCSGGDVHDIIGPLVRMDMKDLLAFTRMTGDLVKAMIHCGRPIVAAVDGICVGAGAIIAMASDIRFGTPEAKTGRMFTQPNTWASRASATSGTTARITPKAKSPHQAGVARCRPRSAKGRWSSQRAAAATVSTVTVNNTA